jgi:excinuclease UvrABC ATPase subunit
MASSFLDNLKNAVDKGEFNSEAAKKILEVSKLADTKIPVGGIRSESDLEDLQKSINDRLEKAGVRTVTEEEAASVNSDYDKKMEEIRLADIENKRIAEQANAVDIQLKTLIEIEGMVEASVRDMITFVEELEDKFEKEIDEENPMFGELSQKIESIHSKYNPIINN